MLKNIMSTIPWGFYDTGEEILYLKSLVLQAIGKDNYYEVRPYHKQEKKSHSKSINKIALINPLSKSVIESAPNKLPVSESHAKFIITLHFNITMLHSNFVTHVSNLIFTISASCHQTLQERRYLYSDGAWISRRVFWWIVCNIPTLI